MIKRRLTDRFKYFKVVNKYMSMIKDFRRNENDLFELDICTKGDEVVKFYLDTGKFAEYFFGCPIICKTADLARVELNEQSLMNAAKTVLNRYVGIIPNRCVGIKDDVDPDLLPMTGDVVKCEHISGRYETPEILGTVSAVKPSNDENPKRILSAIYLADAINYIDRGGSRYGTNELEQINRSWKNILS